MSAMRPAPCRDGTADRASDLVRRSRVASRPALPSASRFGNGAFREVRCRIAIAPFHEPKPARRRIPRDSFEQGRGCRLELEATLLHARLDLSAVADDHDE